MVCQTCRVNPVDHIKLKCCDRCFFSMKIPQIDQLFPLTKAAK